MRSKSRQHSPGKKRDNAGGVWQDELEKPAPTHEYRGPQPYRGYFLPAAQTSPNHQPTDSHGYLPPVAPVLGTTTR